MPLVVVIVAAPPCIPFSIAGGVRGWESKMSHPFVACVNLINGMYEQHGGYLTYIMENVPGSTSFGAIRECLGEPLQMDAPMVRS